jgi:hypothetical protein
LCLNTNNLNANAPVFFNNQLNAFSIFFNIICSKVMYNTNCVFSRLSSSSSSSSSSFHCHHLTFYHFCMSSALFCTAIFIFFIDPPLYVQLTMACPQSPYPHNSIFPHLCSSHTILLIGELCIVWDTSGCKIMACLLKINV